MFDFYRKLYFTFRDSIGDIAQVLKDRTRTGYKITG